MKFIEAIKLAGNFIWQISVVVFCQLIGLVLNPKRFFMSK